MFKFNLLQIWLNKKISEKPNAKPICEEILKTYKRLLNLYNRNPYEFTDEFNSEGLLPYHIRKKIIKHSINGKTFAIRIVLPSYQGDGRVICKFDDDVYIDFTCKPFPYSNEKSFKIEHCKALYKYDSRYSLSFEEYLPYLNDILNFLNSEYEKRKGEKDSEFQRFRTIKNFPQQKESKNLYDENETVEAKYNKLIKEAYDV